MRVLVTGASGFIGARLGAELVRAGHDVRAMTRNPERYAATGTPVFGDVSDPDSSPKTGVPVAAYRSGLRVIARTSWPARTSSAPSRAPMKPDAPVTRTRMPVSYTHLT